jgi:hypothetical protein
MRALITQVRDACGAVTNHLHARYGVSVEVASIAPPLKGDLDGSRILVADHNTDKERLFLVAHLFGHTVQWNVSAELRRLGMLMPVEPTRDELDALEAYEREACRYSQQALHEAGISGLDQWLPDYSACDLAFLKHLYTTGERRAFRDFWISGQPLIEPLAIPPFKPTRWRRREQAIVFRGPQCEVHSPQSPAPPPDILSPWGCRSTKRQHFPLRPQSDLMPSGAHHRV